MKAHAAGLLLAAVLTSAIPGCAAGRAQSAPPQPSAPTAAGFTIRDGRILDPSGRPFLVMGITTVYGTFSGGDEKGFGEVNYRNARRDFGRIKRLGINLVRIFIDYLNLDDYHKARLRNVVSWGRSAGFVVYLSVNGSGGDDRPDFPNALPMLEYLARTYRGDPYVWIGTMNEPNCGGAFCADWEKWQADHKGYIAAVRGAGYTGPIVVNTVYWSSDLSRMDSFPLGDDNLIYGAHRYGNENPRMTDVLRQKYDRNWAGLAQASRYAIIIDEVGAYNGRGFLNSIDWLSDFMDYVADWVNRRGGDGAIGFNWYWSDGNSMSGDWKKKVSDGSLTRWGEIFYRRFLLRVAPD